jgi:hypothetical protein
MGNGKWKMENDTILDEKTSLRRVSLREAREASDAAIQRTGVYKGII